jgi:hypothetical protein
MDNKMYTEDYDKILLSVDNTLEENLHYDEFPNKYSLSIDCGSSACYFDEILHIFTTVS